MIHALTLLAILMFATPVAKFIPLAVLAAILLVVSYNMGEWAEIPELLKLSRLEVACWSATFVLTVFADLTVAVEAGMILAALVFIRKVTATTTISRVTKEYLAESKLHVLQDKEIPPYATVFRIHGPFLFGAADKIDDLMQQIPELPPIVILRLRNMTAIDATGLRALEELADRVNSSGRRLILCGAREQPAQLMRQSEFEQHVGAENICANVTEALARAGVVFPEIAAEAPSVRKWGRRRSDHGEIAKIAESAKIGN
jgi:SulP family sulfate permease